MNGTEHNKITEPGMLLSQNGTLINPGWATSQLLHYQRKDIKASRLRIKEWDYYLVGDSDYALAFTIADMSYIALISASLISLKGASFITKSALGVLPLGRLCMPATSSSGVTQYCNKHVDMYFGVDKGMRHLKVSFQDFADGLALQAEIVLDREPQDSMVIATPWAEDPLAFFYNQKIVGMRAVGSFSLGNLKHDFSDSSALGLLDWGRGVWTYDNTWYWSAAQGYLDGHLVGFNLGYGFGDTSAASENIFFLDGVAHKLDRVDFGIPMRNSKATLIKERYVLDQPWHFTESQQRLDLDFTPLVDRNDSMDYKLVSSDQHQVFGTFNGWVILDDGSRFEIRNLNGFAEAVHNKY